MGYNVTVYGNVHEGDYDGIKYINYNKVGKIYQGRHSAALTMHDRLVGNQASNLR